MRQAAYRRMPHNDQTVGRSAAMEIALTRHLLRSRGGSDAIEYAPKSRAAKERLALYKDRADLYDDMGFLEIAAECIGYTGRIVAGSRISDQILTRAFESTSDFPNIFENVLNKALLARYELQVPTYRKIADERPFNDFRPHPQIRAGEFPAPEPISETGELKVGSTVDSSANVSLSPYGVILTISRQMLVNDELEAIDQILASAALVVGVWENSTFFSMLLSNPVLPQDSTAVFNSAHNNYVQSGDGAAPSISTVAAGRAAMRAMKTPSGNYMNITPTMLLTGPQQETAGQQMLSRITPTLTTSVNPFFNQLTLVSDANIPDASWYLLADPKTLPSFIYGDLKGSNGPRIRVHDPFGVQGIRISAETDFGVGAIDYRGAYYNAGQ